MDRRLIYPSAIPLDTDLLNSERATMVALGYLAKATLGTGTVVDGLVCTPTTPASMQVQIGEGSIYSLQNVDNSDYGSLALDTAHQIVKQGITQDVTTLACPAPGTGGQSVNYLIQAAFSEVDDSAVVLPYYNSANPALPYSGPNNTGSASMTRRADKCVVTVKAGAAATTGTQVTPTPDAGNVALYVITVANGATTITAPNIAVSATAPFIPQKLGSSFAAAIQNNSYTYGAVGGSANAVTVTLGTPPTAYTAGQFVYFIAGSTNTAAMTVNVNTLGAKSIVLNEDGAALVGGEIGANQLVMLEYDGVNFRLLNPRSIVRRGFRNQNYVTSSTTWVVPSGVTSLMIEQTGGGAGGGGSNATTGGGGGGGGGGLNRSIVAVTPGETLTITIGAAGAGGLGTPANGSNGGTTSVTGSFGTLSATGGAGGGLATGGIGGAGGSGGGASGGSYGVGGAQGDAGYYSGSGTARGGRGGDGANGGGGGGASGGSGGPAVGRGGGGGGSVNGAGGAGQAGEVLITY